MSEPGFRITVVHAIVGIGDDDEEGVPAMTIHGGVTLPLIAADETRLSMITNAAQYIADSSGRTFKIVRFSVREDIGEIKPRSKSN